MEEIWKDIVGYEGLYQVSNLGRVKSLDRILTTNSRWGSPCEKYVKGRILKPFTNNCGYLLIFLGRGKAYLVHHLVYQEFIGPIPTNMEINHINEIKTDNRVENLNLMSHKSNHNWGTCHQRSGKKHSKPIMQTTKEGEEFFCWFSLKDASEELGIDIPNLWKALNGKYQTAGGYKWKYVTL